VSSWKVRISAGDPPRKNRFSPLRFGVARFNQGEDGSAMMDPSHLYQPGANFIKLFFFVTDGKAE
jgi:hypothetical protein